MEFKIVGDSCTDLTREDLEKAYMQQVPLTLIVDDHEIVDDETFDQQDFLKKVAACTSCPKSACPSPEAYMKSYEGAQNVYVVTLSSHLSGSYNSAELAKQLYQQEHPEVKIHVFDSESASTGQFLLAHLIEKYALAGMPFEEIVEKVTQFRDQMVTTFVLETLDVLRKNGRLSAVKAMVASALNIKPYMNGDKGVIKQAGQARGMKKAMVKLVEYMGSVGSNMPDKTLVIAHCNCPQRAEFMKEEMVSRYHFKDVVIIDTRGVSSLYANDGGIIVSF